MSLLQRDMKTKPQAILQIIWGLLLMTAGLGLIFRISRIIPGIEQVEAYSSDLAFKEFCLYVIAVFLAGGGIKKIWANYKFMRQYKEKPLIED